MLRLPGLATIALGLTLAASGCKMVRMGIEAGDERVRSVPGNTSCDDDALKVMRAGEFFAYVVKSARQAHPAIVGMDHDLDAIECIPFGIVVADVSRVGDLLPVVPFFVLGVVDDEA